MGRGFVGPQGVGMGQENFPHHAGQGGDRARQNLRGGGEDPILRTYPTPLSSLVETQSPWETKTLYLEG